MASSIDFVQAVFPTTKVYNTWNWIDVTEKRSRIAVFLVDFLDLHDTVVSERCDHLFTCSFSNRRAQHLGHRVAYAGAGVCEVSSLLPNSWTTKELLVGVFWSADELADTAKVCAQMSKSIFAKDFKGPSFLIQVPLYREPASSLTIIIAVIVLGLSCIILGYTILAYLLIKRSYTHKFIILTALNHSATNYIYSNFITKQIIAKCKDMHSVYEQSKTLTLKHKDLSSRMPIEAIKRPMPPKTIIPKVDSCAGKHKEQKQSEHARRHSQSIFLFTSTSNNENEPGNILPDRGRCTSDTSFAFEHLTAQMPKESTDRLVRPDRRVPHVWCCRGRSSHTASIKRSSNMSLETLGKEIPTCVNTYAIDSITSEDQRRACSFLPKQPNIIQTLDNNLRYLSDYPIEKISDLDNNYSQEIHKYQNKTVLFSQIVMPIWSSAQIFSKALELQKMSNSKKNDFAAIEGIFILVIDIAYGTRYILPRELVGICAFTKNNSFRFCMITNLGTYISLIDFSQRIRASFDQNGLTFESFRYNIDLIYELLKICGQRVRDKKDACNVLRDGQAYQDSSMVLEPDLLNSSITEALAPHASSFDAVHTPKPLISISTPSLKDLREMSSQELVDLLKPDWFSVSEKPAKRFITLIHALNAQYISQSSGIAFLQLRSRQTMQAIESHQHLHQQALDSVREEKTNRSVSTPGSRMNRAVLYKVKPSYHQSKFRNVKTIPPTPGVDGLSDVDRCGDDLPIIPLSVELQSTKDNTSDSDCNYYDITAHLYHELERKIDAESSDSHLHMVQTGPTATQSTSPSAYSMSSPFPPKHTTSSTIKLCTDFQDEALLLPASHYKNYRSLTNSITDARLFDECAMQEVYDALAHLGSSVRERVAQLLMKELANRRRSLKDIQYFDKDCILIGINPILGDSEVELELDIKLEPFSMLLRDMNTIPRPILARTDCSNASSVDMYIRMLLIYLELIALLDCTQKDLEEMSIFLAEFRTDVDYGSVFQRLLPLVKDFSTIMLRERTGISLTKDHFWEEYLLPIFA